MDALPALTTKELERMSESDLDDKMKQLVAFVKDHRAVGESNVEDACQLLSDWGTNLLNYTLNKGLDKTQFRKVIPKQVYAPLYTYCHRTATEEDNCNELAEHHRMEIRKYLTRFVVPALDAKHEDALLEEFRRRWEDHKIYTEWMRKMFVYLDRMDNFTGAEARESTTSVSLHEFKTLVFDSKKADIVTTIQTFVNKDRDGETVDRSLLKSVVELFLVMGVAASKGDFANKADVEAAARSKVTGTNETYIDDFETPFIRNSKAIYHTKSTDWLSTDTIPEFLHRVEAALVNEEARVDAYLNPSTWPKLRSELVRVMVQSRAASLLGGTTGLAYMLEEDKRSDLSCCYRLFSLWENGKTPISEGIRDFVRAKGDAIITKRRSRLAGPDARKVAGDDPEFIEELIALQSRFRAVVAECCNNDVDFKKNLQTALNVVVNTNAKGDRDPHPTAELLACFLDTIMKGRRKGSKLAEAEISRALTDIHELFVLLNDKDLFQESHRTLLAQRLLTDASFSNEMEREFIGKLKESQGPTFTGKFEGMITDLTSPDAVTRGFSSKAAGSAWDFRVRTLCHGHWPPSFPTKTVVLPPQLKSAVEEFSSFYKSKQGSRKLDFALADGTMTVRGHFKGKSGKGEWVDLKCGTLQGVLLLQFNASATWKAKDLADSVGLEMEHVGRLLHPLIFSGACRVLLDQTLADDHKAGKKIKKIVEESHMLRFNGRFSSKRRQVVVLPVKLKETHNKAAIDIGRRHVIDAAAVRIMKTRKTMTMQQLGMEVTNQVKRLFAADPRVVKKRIEHLIEQDYLERAEDDRTQLSYVA